MAKKKKLVRSTGGKPVPKASLWEKQIQQPLIAKQKKTVTIPSWIIPSILIITFLAYIPVLNAGFVTLDDGDYVTNNYLLKDFSHLKELLATTVQGNYHPLTMLSLAFNYQVSGMDGWSYHILNLLLHLINCILVFRLVFLLSNKNVLISFTTAILFGIHPLHVESVAWISERKDVLYGLFFLLGLISYTKYADTGSGKQYVLTILFLILSLLSKPAAVIFPVVLFCIDLLRKRKLNFKLLLEKIPFFILALAGGIGSLMAQRAAEATGTISFGFTWTMLFGFYGIMMYIIKMILPVGLAPFYSFPAINQSLPVEYYAGPIFFIALAILFYYSLKKNRAIAFGISFYVVNLLLVLQFLPVGSAVIAERYTYIPYIGLFFIIGWLIDRYSKTNTTKAYSIIFTIAVIFSIFTFKQAGVWHDGVTLWDHAIKTQPSAKAYSNRALLLRKEKKYSLAIEYYRKAIHLNKIDKEVYSNLANVYFDLKQPDSAFLYYKKALEIKPNYHPAMDNMGAQFAVIGQYDSALKYFSKALEINPDYKQSYSNRALLYIQLNRNEEAIRDWEKFLQYEPNSPDVYNSIGSCYRALGKLQESLININKAIQFVPDANFIINRSYTYYALKNIEQAKADALTAKQAGLKIPDDYAKSLGIQ